MLSRLALVFVLCWIFVSSQATASPMAQTQRVASASVAKTSSTNSATATRNNSPAAKPKKKRRHWPKPKALIAELTELSESTQAKAWSNEMLQLIDLLQATTKIDEAQAQITLGQISRKSLEVQDVINQIASAYQGYALPPETADLLSQLQRISYKVERRLAIWSTLNQHASVALARQSELSDGAIQQVGMPRISFDQLDPQWAEYLTLDEAQKAFRSLTPDPVAQTAAARKILARIYSPALAEEQRTYLNQVIDPSILSLLKETASEEVDHFRLLALIELYESTDSAAAAHHLNDQYQNLFWSEDPLSQTIANQLQSHYRNANVRIAVNQRLLNQVIPQMPSTTEPISENVDGARISGQNHIQNQLRVSLIENPENIDLQIETFGQVDSQISARKSGFTIQNQGKASFQVFKRLAFSRTGVTSDKPSAFSQAKQRLVGLRGKHDRVPVIGWLARRIAHQKVTEETPKNEKMVEDRIESMAKDRMQEEVETQVTAMRESLNTRIVMPLVAIDLEPDPVQLATTREQIVTRYRLAGRDQLAAHTARPTDESSDLVNVQVHQTAVNNFAQRLDLNGKEFTPETLQQHLQQIIGFQAAPMEMENEAKFKFSQHDPIRIDFRNGEITFEIRLLQLQIDNGKTWKRLKIATTYKPQFYGTKMVLNQKDGIDLDGKGLGIADEMAIRTVCEVILEKTYQVDVLPASIVQQIPSGGLNNLAIDRLSIADGWFAVAFNESQVMPVGNWEVPLEQMSVVEQMSVAEQPVIVEQPINGRPIDGQPAFAEQPTGLPPIVQASTVLPPIVQGSRSAEVLTERR